MHGELSRELPVCRGRLALFDEAGQASRVWDMEVCSASSSIPSESLMLEISSS